MVLIAVRTPSSYAVGLFQWLTLIVVGKRILTSRIRSPTLAAFSFITLTRLPQYYQDQQIRQNSPITRRFLQGVCNLLRMKTVQLDASLCTIREGVACNE